MARTDGGIHTDLLEARSIVAPGGSGEAGDDAVGISFPSRPPLPPPPEPPEGVPWVPRRSGPGSVRPRSPDPRCPLLVPSPVPVFRPRRASLPSYRPRNRIRTGSAAPTENRPCSSLPSGWGNQLRTRLRPAFFALYNFRSAVFTSSLRVIPGLITLTPALSETVTPGHLLCQSSSATAARNCSQMAVTSN